MAWYKETYLIIRFSSLGNVAMLVPPLACVAQQFPQTLFLVLTQNRFADMFVTIPNIQVIASDTPSKAERTRSILQIYRQIRAQYDISYVCDMQNCRQSRLLTLLFRWSGIKTARISSPKQIYYQLLRKGYSADITIPTQFELYQQVLQCSGLEADNTFKAIAINTEAADGINALYGVKDKIWLGIAPFAKSKTNMLPYSITKAIIAYFAQKNNIRLFLFGAGKVECEMLGQWAQVNPHITSVAGTLTLAQELELIRRLDLMVGMDSANQHLSSMVGTRCLSIWAGTHPKAGFYGWKQKPEDIIQQPLSCRPCTIHGKNSCFYHNFLCKQFSTAAIIERINKIVHSNK